jgi:rhomboid protease GluP
VKFTDDAPRPPPTPDFDPQLRMQAIDAAFVQTLAERKPLASYALIGANVLLYLLQLSLGRHLENVGVNSGRLVAQGQLWRLGSCMFLHGGLIHIGSNMLALWSIGPFLEKVMGSARFVVLYAVSGLAGSVASAAIHPAISSLGASGAIFGLMGGALGLALMPHRLLPPWRAQFMRKSIVQPLLINLGISFLPSIDGTAHFGGGLMGFALMLAGVITFGAKPSYMGEHETSSSRGLWMVLAIVCALAMLLAVGVAVLLAVLTPAAS